MSTNFYSELKNHFTFPKITILPVYTKYTDDIKMFTFRTYICELIYNAVQLFPEISEYTIACTNDIGTITIKLGEFEDPETDIPDIATLTDNEFYCSISKLDIVKMYVANRSPTPDYTKVDVIISILYSGGYEPIVKTSYVINQDYIKLACKK